MLHETLIPFFDLIGMIACIVAGGYGIANYQASDIERPFWFAFSVTAALGALWLALVSLEWFGYSAELMDQFSTSLQAVVIGLYAVGVVGAYVIVRDLEQSRYEVEERASLVSVLSRVLRHNIRNDITVIRGYMMADGDREIVQEKIDDLIATSEKARKLEQALLTDGDLRSVEIGKVARRVVDEVGAAQPGASIELEVRGDETATVDLAVQTGLQELVENGVVHGDGAVTVTVDVTPVTIDVTVTDEGAGISPYERQLLDVEEETSLLHSSGIGLWLARWVVNSQGGDIAADVTADGTTMTVTLPRQRSDRDERPQRWPESPAPGFDRYRAIFNQRQEACIVYGDDGRILDVNPRAGEVLEMAPSALLGRQIGAVLPGDIDAVELIERVHEAGEIQREFDWTGTTSTWSYGAMADVVLGEHLLVIREE